MGAVLASFRIQNYILQQRDSLKGLLKFFI